MTQYDVIVVGAGNAALAAAVSARENGAERVVVLEKAPREMRGGNTHWSGGVLRFASTTRARSVCSCPASKTKWKTSMTASSSTLSTISTAT